MPPEDVAPRNCARTFDTVAWVTLSSLNSFFAYSASFICVNLGEEQCFCHIFDRCSSDSFDFELLASTSTHVVLTISQLGTLSVEEDKSLIGNEPMSEEIDDAGAGLGNI